MYGAPNMCEQIKLVTPKTIHVDIGLLQQMADEMLNAANLLDQVVISCHSQQLRNYSDILQCSIDTYLETFKPE
jgi:hypothetical protein